MPDPACTPGAVFASATRAQICVSGYTARVRNVSETLKSSIYAAYGIASHAAGSYEVDHLVPLELGGSNARANLWPERAPGFGRKDSLENAFSSHAEAQAYFEAHRDSAANLDRDRDGKACESLP